MHTHTCKQSSPALLFVLFSLLHHQELRFIVLVFPSSMWWLVWALPTCEWGLSTLNTQHMHIHMYV